MLILGIDPSLRRTGFSVVRFVDRPELIHYGAIETNTSMSHTQCLIKISKTLSEIASGFEVGAAAMEDNAIHIGRTEDMGRRYTLGEVSGAIKVVLAVKNKLEVAPVSLQSSRKLILGKNPWKDQKRLVHEAVKAVTGKQFENDEADSIVSANYLARQLGLPHWHGDSSTEVKFAIERVTCGAVDAERCIKKILKLKSKTARMNCIMKAPRFVLEMMNTMELCTLVREIVDTERKRREHETKESPKH